ncbi:MAG TPA: hypothetical protein VEB22_07905, partial [Phycisphaerales bacterium]|nr:hypothetical protein [Phycisphaerales bacterium]
MPIRHSAARRRRIVVPGGSAAAALAAALAAGLGFTAVVAVILAAALPALATFAARPALVALWQLGRLLGGEDGLELFKGGFFKLATLTALLLRLFVVLTAAALPEPLH